MPYSKHVPKLFPELSFLLLPIAIFQLLYYLIRAITWPIWGPIRFAWRLHRKHQERASRALYEARQAERLRQLKATEERIEQENVRLRASGHYVPEIRDRDVMTICNNVAYMYGQAWVVAHRGVGSSIISDALSAAESKFGESTSSVFGIDPRHVLSNIDSNACLAFLALTEVTKKLSVRPDNDGNMLIAGESSNFDITGNMGCEALGIFARIAGSSPKLNFWTQNFCDYYYVASSFAPSYESIEDAATLYAHRQPDFTPRKPVTGTFDTRLWWLKRIFEDGNRP
jgi:hypothetical protein